MSHHPGSASPTAVHAPVLLGAAALLLALVVPLALAGADSGDPRATASASVAKQVKKLKGQVAQLQQQVNNLSLKTGPPGPPGPPGTPGTPGGAIGPAGGDLTGDYPNPEIAPNAVGTDEVANESLTGADVSGLTGADVGGLTGGNITNGSLTAFDISPVNINPSRDPVSMATGTCTSEASSGPTVDLGDLVMVVPPDNMPSGFVAFGEFTDTEDNAEFRICNFSGGTVDPPNMVFRIFVLRP
jgi:hypothetical protein